MKEQKNNKPASRRKYDQDFKTEALRMIANGRSVLQVAQALIVGYCLHPFLTAEGSLKALDMALATHLEREQELIHHSDRGSQYCSFDYVRKLKGANILISMTQHGDPFENDIAERVNGILKTDFRLNRVFITFDEAEKAVEKSIYNYNHLRPHMSCGYLTPVVAHQSEQPLKKHWKPKVYKRSKTVRDQGQFGKTHLIYLL
ncbi:integrase core domain-containing protein [Spirosoma spitsbergense]|uniref:integrase core domain-containing protein n=1 Tax=Spirosoma spitsbergense TaxID=431554 RepID=UPI0003659607|nr:integrase core domain-containing protein [Spirosoma spitsbergense]